MKLKEQELIEQDSIGQFKEITSSIRTEDLGLAFDMVSKNLYSDPIASFVRELTSNGVDANIDNNAESPVEVQLYEEGEQWYITFKDYGLGMNPDLFEGIYMNWFASDKRDTDSKIGGWGLGSKSPLAYVDYFDIKTIADNIEYNYVISRGEKAPFATLISSKETTEPSGTTIKIEVKSEDLNRISYALQSQLAYFKNVYVRNEYSYYDNHFTIYESDDFIIRNNISLFNNQMHICLGQVAYPIDWNILNMNSIDIPVALKFDIGELPVVISRESIDYKEEEVKSLITSKILKVEEYLKNLYEKSLIASNMKDFIDLVYTEDKPLIIGDINISYNAFKKYRFRPLYEPLNIRCSKNNLERIIDLLFKVVNIKKYKLEDSWRNAHTAIRYSTTRQIKNSYNSWDIKYLVEESTYSIDILKVRNYKRNFNLIAEYLNLAVKSRIKKGYNDTVTLKEGSLITIYTFIKDIYKYVDESFELVDGCASPGWIEEKKEEERQYQESRKDIVTIYNESNKMTSINIGELMDSADYILYINKKEDLNIKYGYNIFYNSLPSYYKKKIRFIILTPTNIKKLKKFKNKFKPAENVWKIKSLNKHFRRLYLTNRRNSIIDYSSLLYNTSYYYYSLYLKTRQYNIDLHKTIYPTNSYDSIDTINIYEIFKEEIHDNMYKGLLYNEHLLEKLISLEPYFKVINCIYDKYGDISFILCKLKLLKFNSINYKS